MGSDLSVNEMRAADNKHVQTIQTVADVRRNPATGPAKKPATPALPLVNQGMRESVVAQVCVFGKSCGQIARQMGLERHTVERVLIQEMSKQSASEYRRGYKDGRRPNPPASALRPQLRRAA